jgi:hypothetical protein
MLMSSNKFGFVVSADEIMFLWFDIVEKVDYDLYDGPDPVVLYTEPHMYYSDPIKLADVFNEDEGTISVRMAILYLIHCSITGEYELPAEMGSALNYAAKTKPGERYVPYLKHRDPRVKRKGGLFSLP